MKFEFSWQIFEKYSDIKFYEIPPNGSRIVPLGRTEGQRDWQTHMTELVAFQNFTNAPQNTVRFWTWSVAFSAYPCMNLNNVLSR